jgi:hypothetical protein
MSFHLLIDDASGANWRVPDGADPQGLLAEMRAAMETGEVIEVAVQTGSNPPKNVRLQFNGASVGTVALVEI